MDLKKYHGLFPAFYACYDHKSAVSPDRIKALVRYYLKKGVDGLYVNSPAGECFYLNVEERKQILSLVMEEAAGRMGIICHVGAIALRDSFSLAEHAAEMGVTAISMTAPLFSLLPDYSIVKYWNRISSAAKDTEIIIHNAPKHTGTRLSRELFYGMWENEKLVGVINQDASIEDVLMQFAMAGEDYVIFNGDDEYFLPGRALGMVGAMGGISGIMPELYQEIDRRIEKGDLAGARLVQHRVMGIVDEIRKANADPLAVCKGVIRRLEVIDLGAVRPPLPALYDEDLNVVKKVSDMIRDAKDEFIQ